MTAAQTPTVVTRAATLAEAQALRADLQPGYLHWWIAIVDWPRAPQDAKPYALVLGQRRVTPAEAAADRARAERAGWDTTDWPRP
jgi:hypothetical protein